ncbi:hypothetical protein N9089_04445, partial [Crocinitomicaceae bacterium]|nr:hypothetical protein [Crocinitomicaceae bacterium]
EQFFFAVFKGLCGASLRFFAFPLLHLSSPALALQFCLAFAFFDQARYIKGRLYQFAYDRGDSGREVAHPGFPPLPGPLGMRVGRIGLQTQSVGREIVCWSSLYPLHNGHAVSGRTHSGAHTHR